MNLTAKLLLNKNTSRFAISALQVYKTYLNTKVRGLNFAINNLKSLTLKSKEETNPIQIEQPKEDTQMKTFLKFFAVAALAALAAAVYYMYKKDKHLKNLEDMMYGEHFEDDFFDDEGTDYTAFEEEVVEPTTDETI